MWLFTVCQKKLLLRITKGLVCCSSPSLMYKYISVTWRGKSSGKESRLLLVTFDKEQLKNSIMKRPLNFEKAKGGTLLSNTRSYC